MVKECYQFILEQVGQKRPVAPPQSKRAQTGSEANQLEMCIDDHIIVDWEDTDELDESNSANNDSTNTNSATASTHSVSHTTALYHETKLLQILDRAQAPHYLFQEIMQWSQQAQLKHYTFMPECKTRVAQINHLKKWLKFPKSCEPKQIDVELPGPYNQSVPVTVFDNY